MSTDWKKTLDKEVEILKQARDEMRVQLHLGAAEVRDTWARMEKKWEHLEARLHGISAVTQDSAEEVEAASKKLIEEIKQGYKRVRDAL